MNLEAGPLQKTLNDPAVAELVITNAREHAIMILDEAGCIESWSKGAEQIFGFAADEVIGQPGALLFVPSDVAAQVDERELEVARKEGRAENSRWHVRKTGERFWANGVTMRLDGETHGFLKILRDETPSKLADEQRILLLHELNHRIKNTLATVQSLAEQTLRAAKVDPRTRANLTDRLMALSKAHDLLVQENWAGAELHAVVDEALRVHRTAEPDRLQVDGPPVRLSPQQAVALSLALHELATNALKYGALSTPAGRVAVTWNFAQDGQGRRYMNLLWRETGGPRVKPPAKTGFGTRLLARTFSREEGSAKLEYLDEGLQCVVELRLSDEEEMPILDVESVRHGRASNAGPHQQASVQP
jgi:PAS domain S-box-containing protein